MVALLAFTMLAYANVWFIKLETRGISQEPSVESAAPDLSGMSREEAGEYLVQEVQRQLANPDQYLAKALGVTNAPPLPALTSTPSPTPQQFQQPCNSPVLIGQLPSFVFGSPKTVSFVAPRPSAGSQSASEFYGVGLCFEGSLCSMRLGRGGFSLGSMDILFSGVAEEREVSDTSASDRFIAYLVVLPQEQAEILVVRYIGANGVPDGPGGDDVTNVIFDTRQTPGIFFPSVSGSRIDIAGNKLAFLVQYGPNLQQRHIITMDLAANGTPTGISVPTASSVMRYPTANHQILDMQVGGSGAIALHNFETSTRFVSVVDLLSPGLDGQWGNFDDQRWTGGGINARGAGSFDFSETGQYLVFSVANNQNPNIPIDLEFEDTGSDFVPNTTDDNSGSFTPSGTNNGNGIWGKLSVGDFIPSPPLVRPSAVRVTGIYVNPSGIWTPYFIEADADNQLNMQPNKEITFSLGGHYVGTYSLASEQNISFFTYSSQLHDTLFGIPWCYQ